MTEIAVQTIGKTETADTTKITSTISSMVTSMIAAVDRTCISRIEEVAGRIEESPIRINNPRMSNIRTNKTLTRQTTCRMAVMLAMECKEATNISINKHMADTDTKTTATTTGTTNNSKSRSLSSSTGNSLHMSSHPSTQARMFQTSTPTLSTIHRTTKELSTVSTRTR